MEYTEIDCSSEHYTPEENFMITLDRVIEDEWEKGKKRKKGNIQQWKLIPKNQLIHVWNEFAKLGYTRHDKLIEEWSYLIILNIMKLECNNIISGHTPQCPKRYLELELEVKRVTEKQLENYYDYYSVDENDCCRISDYAMRNLYPLCIELIGAKTSEDKLILIDRVLNVVHMRSDLASWFVEGGSNTLSELAERQTTEVSAFRIAQ